MNRTAHVTVLGRMAQASAARALSGAQTLVAALADNRNGIPRHGLIDALDTCVERARLLVVGVGADTYAVEGEAGSDIVNRAYRASEWRPK